MKSKEDILEYRRLYRLKNKAKIKEYKKIFYLNNKEKINNSSKIYKIKNKDKIKTKAIEDRIKNKERNKEYGKKYRESKKDNLKIYFKESQRKEGEKLSIKKLFNRYEITELEYKNLIEIQENNCKICGINQSKLKRKLAVDHCHKTGIVRGLLCGKCNAGIGMLCDDYKIVLKAYEYLKNSGDGSEEN